MDYEAVIGLEIHVQLNNATKMFCDCPNRPGDEPNQNTCPICLWIPGAMPRFSQVVLEKATMAGLALNCEIQKENAFDQKVYYYPDLPKGFQLSQSHLPLAKNGWLDITDENGQPKRIRIHQVHMEEDVAKLVHETEGHTPISLVDFNRAGTPLVEIVSEPDIRTPHEAMEYIRSLRTQIRYVDSAECSMESGTMRVDANISIRPKNSDRMNTKVEVKNMNSIHNVGNAIAYEITRQANQLQKGEAVVLHTRLWNPDKHVTEAMRGKFEGPCVPDPSVPRIIVTDEWLNTLKARLPEMPGGKAERFFKDYGLSRDEAVLMSSERNLSEYFEAVVNQDIPPRFAVHWIATQLLPALKERNQNVEDTPVTTERFSQLLSMLERDEINANSAKEVLAQLFDSTETPGAVIEKGGLRQVSNTSEIEVIVDQIITENRSAVDDFHNGKTKAMGFLVGRAMQASQGKANPRLIKEMLSAKLGNNT